MATPTNLLFLLLADIIIWQTDSVSHIQEDTDAHDQSGTSRSQRDGYGYRNHRQEDIQSAICKYGELELHFKASGLQTLKIHKKPTHGASSLRMNTFLQ